MKIALGIEYYGGGFSGWQHQARAAGVQTVLEEALGKVAAQPVRLVCAGRTDAGVHASQQVAHFETAALRPMRAWVLGANACLPPTVSVLWAREVEADFHARFSALARTYRYYILNRPVRSACCAGRVSWIRRALEPEPMQLAAAQLLGEHDFTSFRAAACQAHSPMRTIHCLHIERRGEMLRFVVTANAFLYRMVRNIIGVLMKIGLGHHSPEWAGEVLRARDRTLAGVTASPDGLYLHHIRYPERYAFPAPSEPFVVF